MTNLVAVLIDVALPVWLNLFVSLPVPVYSN